MSDPSPTPSFLVDAESDPVAVRIQGRASFQNSGSLQEFVQAMIASGRTRFVIDFQNCTSMDSTFLGVLAGAALRLRKLMPVGSLVLCRIGQRNLELVNNLGLNRLLTVDLGADAPTLGAGATPLAAGPAKSELESARHVLAAHENLIAADESNKGKFQDVLTFLRSRVDQG